MRRSECSPEHAQAGTTYVEVIVAVLISTLVVALLYLALATSLRAYGRTTAAAARASELVRADELIREAVANVRAPFWPVAFAESSPGSIKISFFQGDPNRTLVVQWSDTELRLVESGGPSDREPMVLRSSIAGVWLRKEGERVVGLSVALGDPPQTIEALFSGWHLP